MRKHVKTMALLILGAGLMTSCVSKKKYEALESQRMQLNQELDEAKSTISDLQSQNEEIQNRSAELERDLDDLNESMTQVQNTVKTVEKERNVAVDKIKTIKDEIDGVLMKDENIDLEEKDGKLYVTLGDDILYRFGSTRVSSTGKDVIDNVANILSNHPDVKVIIESHTDHRGLKEGAAYRDNWDLSVARSANVVRQMIKSGVSPEQLLAAGQAEFEPVVEGDNLSIEELAPNRRTEFIILPDVRPLISISESINP
ncbi:OmpA family protein [Membranicola marinus]|uniref:OmpA family protein n=1 Tax=Membranihabitans marinus TaxID=1227546 RepID=A0A953HQA6_9BACT|nr:OmpA family protein [Membranihabitans marinus]MBY5958883.1 OmpA family protein [Membranihabitans marinus]